MKLCVMCFKVRTGVKKFPEVEIMELSVVNMVVREPVLDFGVFDHEEGKT